MGKLISVHSPVEISLLDSQGNHVGKTSAGDVEVGIPGAMYEELGENKFIFVPEPEEPTSISFTILLDGTATGTFNLRITDIASVQTQEGVPSDTGKVSLFLDVPVGAQSTGFLPITFSGPQEPTLLYDLSGDGQVSELNPDSITVEADESDLVPPTTTIQIIGLHGDNSWYRSSITTTLTAVDESSGVLRIMYSLDGGVTWSRYVEPIRFDADGRHVIHYYGIDNLGNREDEKSLSLSIDKTPPEARFSFSPQLRDVLVIGVDAMSTTTVSTTPNIFTVRDEAGNTLQLVFAEINRPTIKRASLSRLVYNGRVVMPGARLTSFVRLTNTRNEISSLQQALRYNLDEGLYALYTKLGGRTFIRERNNWNSFQDRYESGMKVFNFYTQEGMIFYN
jgi:hypothetical protein